ncbi:MAG TPA: HD domain-containing phosphohydrolase [Pyrinomonadaceae bacterium]|jgi:response regulator RpfG family c-di-GMP phosphodiesterase|nr:HD domain-containing phosphohydrolase [Pyrinomonadaceae bacterium]
MENINKKILCIDDDPNILEGLRRGLRRDFNVFTAESGLEAFGVIKEEGPFAVVVSDMRMHGMNGVQVLSRVREIAPDTVRIMLTGNADQQTAMDAVNEGSIFRFLTKPCAPEAMIHALNSGVEQYRLLTAEKQLLEETLNNSLQVMVEILAVVNSTAFSRSTRVKKLARNLATRCGILNAWEVEIAAMLSQIGCVAVPESILQKVVTGRTLTGEEFGLLQQHSQIGHDLIARIPRMETVAEIILNQNRKFEDTLDPNAKNRDAVRGARIIKVVLDFDKLLEGGQQPATAFKELMNRAGWYEPAVLENLKNFIDNASEQMVSMTIPVGKIKAGMQLDEAIFSANDVLLLSQGQEITPALLVRLVNLASTGMIADMIKVKVPVDAFEFAALAEPAEAELEAA